jgi:hypothetical protein
VIERYFVLIEDLLRDFPVIRSYSLTKKIYNIQQGYIGGKIDFENGHFLEFIEVMDTGVGTKLKYRYHYMDEAQHLIFRYDNAPHHPEIASFPHHKHIPGEVSENSTPTLKDVLLEIAQRIKQKP